MSLENNNSSSRWWEFYLVRYGMGTVVGAIIVYMLCKTDPTLQPLLVGAISSALDANTLLLLVAYGLTFCYVASAPILVLHTCRFAFQFDDSQKTTKLTNIIKWFSGPVIVAPLFYFWFDPDITISTFCKHEYPADYWFRVGYFTVMVSIVWLQYLGVFYSAAKSKALFNFYENLADNRSLANTSFIESYRHLREHGNSFFIVIMEIFLALALQTVTPLNSISAYIMVVVIWILPAALVWIVGTKIELHLANRKVNVYSKIPDEFK